MGCRRDWRQAHWTDREVEAELEEGQNKAQFIFMVYNIERK